MRAGCPSTGGMACTSDIISCASLHLTMLYSQIHHAPRRRRRGRRRCLLRRDDGLVGRDPVGLLDLSARAPDRELGLERGDVLLKAAVGGLRFGKEGLELERGEFCIDAGGVLDALGPNTEA